MFVCCCLVFVLFFRYILGTVIFMVLNFKGKLSCVFFSDRFERVGNIKNTNFNLNNSYVSICKTKQAGFLQKRNPKAWEAMF